MCESLSRIIIGNFTILTIFHIYAHNLEFNFTAKRPIKWFWVTNILMRKTPHVETENRLSTKVNKRDVIKQNESKLANTVFKIQSNKANNFFYFLLFVQSFNCLYLWNQLPNLCGIFTKLKPKQYLNRKCQKNPKNLIFSTSDSFCFITSQFIF